MALIPVTLRFSVTSSVLWSVDKAFLNTSPKSLMGGPNIRTHVSRSMGPRGEDWDNHLNPDVSTIHRDFHGNELATEKFGVQNKANISQSYIYPEAWRCQK